MTDGKENIGGWAGFLSSLGIRFLTLVPYHPMGAVKRTWLGLPDGPDLRTPTEAELKGIEELSRPKESRCTDPAMRTSPLRSGRARQKLRFEATEHHPGLQQDHGEHRAPGNALEVHFRLRSQGVNYDFRKAAGFTAGPAALKGISAGAPLRGADGMYE